MYTLYTNSLYLFAGALALAVLVSLWHAMGWSMLVVLPIIGMLALPNTTGAPHPHNEPEDVL